MKYGVNARVGNLTVFSREGAIRAYGIFCGMFNKNMCMETSAAQSAAMLDMIELGFTAEECEQIEIMTLEKSN